MIPGSERSFFVPLLVTESDHRHPVAEMRFFTMGETKAKRLLAVAHTEKEEFLRIISARDVNATERRRDEDGL